MISLRNLSCQEPQSLPGLQYESAATVSGRMIKNVLALLLIWLNLLPSPASNLASKEGGGLLYTSKDLLSISGTAVAAAIPITMTP